MRELKRILQETGESVARLVMIRRLVDHRGHRKEPSRVVDIVDGTEPIPHDLRLDVDRLLRDVMTAADVGAMQRQIEDLREQNAADAARWQAQRTALEQEIAWRRDQYRELAKAAGYTGNTGFHPDVIAGIEQERANLLRRAKGESGGQP